MRKHLFYLAFLFFLVQINAQTVVWSDNFDDEDISDWTTYDEDGDGHNWGEVFQVVDGITGNPVSTVALISRSWQVVALTPDNWAVSPVIDLTGISGTITLKWKVQAAAFEWDNEHYSVYAATGSDIADLEASSVTFSETYDDPDDAGPQLDREMDLSSFAGQVIHIAFRHHNVTDMDWLSIDDVVVEAETGGDPEPEDYCIPDEPDFNDATGITNVTFESIDNTTTGEGTYQDYTDMVADVEAGGTYPLSMKVDTQGDYYVNAKAWIDWNNDGIFDTATEEYDLGQAHNVDDGAPDLSPIDIAVPADASGEYRLRVRGSFGEDTEVVPCEAQDWSETEDYTINVGEGDPEPVDYCIPEEPTFNDATGITNVTFEGIDNTTTGEGTYQDYTAMVAEVEAGGTYLLSARVDTEGDYYVNVRAWIDWNNDGVFDTDTEEYDLGQANNVEDGAPDLSPVDIAVPADASGEYRLRVRGSFGEDTEVVPCDPQNWSETEDYTINVDEGGGEPGGPCDEKIVMECGETYTATLNPGEGEWVNYTDVTWDYTGSEQVYEFTAPETGTYVFEVNEGENDADFFLMDACSNTANNLIGGYWTGGGGDESVDLIGGTTYYLIADLYSGSSSPSTITVKVTCPDDPGPGDEYCEPVLDCTDGDLITNVTFQEINNDSDCGPDGYNDYTSMTANVNAGETYQMSVTVGSGWTYESVMVWIDFNNNFEFEPSEYYFIGSDPGTTNVGEVMIPEGTAEGQYRMRVRAGAVNPDLNDLSTLACDEDTVYGEIEDYTINVGESTGGNECDQMFDGEFSLANSISGDLGYTVANDFIVAANNSMEIESLRLLLLPFAGSDADFDSFDVRLLSDNAMTPGDPIVEAEWLGLTGTSELHTETFAGYNTYWVTLELPDYTIPASSTDTHYWLSVNGYSVTATNIFWVGYDYVEGSDTASNYQSEDGGITWVQITYDGVGDHYESIWEMDATCELGVSDMNSFAFTYYPNPVKDVLNIDAKKPIENITVYNLTGQAVMQNLKAENGQVNMSGLTPGVYIFRVMLQGGQVETFKIIKK